MQSGINMLILFVNVFSKKQLFLAQGMYNLVLKFIILLIYK